eukprot:TRINITY_DN40498_c0_g2_i1.p1 TRINITY_DN40498_c0_g2~~TRINITY_DN40498_c0_g2_i1.p1  ORF type:complete len:283 (-),score=41.52 TRINITY_DN40498_c0_g2_i1:201-1049(-)
MAVSRMVLPPPWALPCLITLGALCCGLSSIRAAALHQYSASVQLLMTAAILDAMDGHVARAINACTALGAELDSLCDLADFGVAPAVISYFWGSNTLEDSPLVTNELLWGACLIYACCCCLRLARFNLHDRAVLSSLPEPPTRPGNVPVHNLFQRKLYFEGVPAPVAASYMLMPVMLHCLQPTSPLAFAKTLFNKEGLFATTIAIAFLMVSSLPTLSTKMLKQNVADTHLRSRSVVNQVAKLVVVAVASVAVYQYPIEVFLGMNASHILSIPIGLVLYAQGQ